MVTLSKNNCNRRFRWTNAVHCMCMQRTPAISSWLPWIIDMCRSVPAQGLVNGCRITSQSASYTTLRKLDRIVWLHSSVLMLMYCDEWSRFSRMIMPNGMLVMSFWHDLFTPARPVSVYIHDCVSITNDAYLGYAENLCSVSRFHDVNRIWCSHRLCKLNFLACD